MGISAVTIGWALLEVGADVDATVRPNDSKYSAGDWAVVDWFVGDLVDLDCSIVFADSIIVPAELVTVFEWYDGFGQGVDVGQAAWRCEIMIVHVPYASLEVLSIEWN